MATSLKKFSQILCTVGLLIGFYGAPSGASELFTPSRGFLNPDKVLSVDDAFKLQVLESDTGPSLVWEIAEGYYLYKDKISIVFANKALPLRLPKGAPKDDLHFGPVEVYYDRLVVKLDLPADTGRDTVTASYQGCAEAGVCYPQHTQEMDI